MITFQTALTQLAASIYHADYEWYSDMCAELMKIEKPTPTWLIHPQNKVGQRIVAAFDKRFAGEFSLEHFAVFYAKYSMEPRFSEEVWTYVKTFFTAFFFERIYPEMGSEAKE